MSTIGFVGLGAMGAPMSERLRQAFGSVVVYDARPEAMASLAGPGVTPCSSPAEVADRADIVGLSLPGPAAVLAAVCGPDGLLAGRPFQTLVDFSTSGPDVAAQIRDPLAKAGIGYVDAPVSGGVPAARAGTLSVMLAGAPEALASVDAVLAVVGERRLTVSATPGHAQVAKVINNLLSATAVAATAEVLALAVRSGLDVERLLDVVNVSSGRNTATSDKFPKYVLPRTFDFGFRLDLMVKDVDLCLEQARRLGVSMLLGGTVQQLWRLGAQSLEPGCDSTAIAQLFEGWAGVTLAGGDGG
jgi:3-hydroxyisobutyrate dehydrogenase-like beta-hydroxyacid dehydrogenase